MGKFKALPCPFLLQRSMILYSGTFVIRGNIVSLPQFQRLIYANALHPGEHGLFAPNSIIILEYRESADNYSMVTQKVKTPKSWLLRCNLLSHLAK